MPFDFAVLKIAWIAQQITLPSSRQLLFTWKYGPSNKEKRAIITDWK